MNRFKIFNFLNSLKYYNAVNLLNDKQYVKALKIFNKLLNDNFYPFYVLFSLISIHEELNSLNELLNHVDCLLVNKKYDYEELLIQKGHILYLMGEYENSIDCFNEVLDFSPNNLWANYFKCIILNKYYNINQFDQLFARIKGSSDYYLMEYAGISFFEENMLNESLYCFERSLEQSPKNDEIWMYKGLVLKELGKLDESLDSLNISLKHNANNPDVWAIKGMIFNSKGEYKKAISCFDEGLNLDSNNVLCVSNRAISLFHLNKFDESWKCCELSLKLDSNNCQIWYNYVTMLQYKKQFEEALMACDEGLKVCPNDLNLLMNKLILLNDLKRWENILETSNKILIIKKDCKLALDLKVKALQKLNLK